MIKTTITKGNFGIFKVATKAMEKGYTVSLTSEGSRYDLIIDRNGKLDRVQVKYCSNKKGVLRVVIKKINHRRKTISYTKSDIDVFAVYNSQTEEILWIPIERCENKSAISIRVEPTKNGQQRGVLFKNEFMDW